MQQKDREYCPLLRPAKREEIPVRSDFQRAEDMELKLRRRSNVAP